MATHQQERVRHAGSSSSAWAGGQLGIDTLQLCERPLQRGSSGPDWTAIPEGVLLLVGRHLDSYNVGNARIACKSWRRAFSLNVRTARVEIAELRATQARAFLRAFIRAYPSTTELVLDVTFRRTAREKIQAALEEHFQALHDFGVQSLQLNLDLNSFNERKIKLPDVSLLALWNGLTRLTLQESGWRSQQLRVDAGTVFAALPSLQELSVVCKYSGNVKAKWWRPPSSAERLAARMPTWPPGSATAAAAAAVMGAAAGPEAGAGAQDGSAWAAPAMAAGGRGFSGGDAPDGRDAAMEDVLVQLPQQPPQHAAPAPVPQHVRPVLTQHLRCQMTQNQSMSGELSKALRRITPALQPHVSALTFEIVEETYAEPSRCTTPLELSGLPGLKSLSLLSGAEDALAHSRLDIVGAAALETLVIFDVACGCWCYKKPGHGIPPRLLTAPPACLRSLTVVGFVVNQCQNLHALASLTCLEELRLEQPDPDTLSAVAGELLLSWLPPSLRVLKLHSVVLPPCSIEAAAVEPPAYGAASGFGRPHGSAAAPDGSLAAAAAAAAAASSGAGAGAASDSAAQLLYGVAPVSPLPQLRELYLSKCKVPTLGVLGVCGHLTSLGVINCLSCSGMLPVPAAMPALRSLALSYTLAAEQEVGTTCGPSGPGGPQSMSALAYGAAGAAGSGGFAAGGLAPPLAARSGPAAALTLRAAAGLPSSAVPPSAVPPVAPAAAPLHASLCGLPLSPVVWGSDEQVAAVASCRGVTSLELILPRGTAGSAAVAAVARMSLLTELDVCLPCGPSESLMGLARLGGEGSGRLQRLTLWVDGRTCVNRNRARQLQAIQRNLQAHMPHTLVEWAGAESRHGSWTGLEAKVFNPH